MTSGQMWALAGIIFFVTGHPIIAVVCIVIALA